MSAFQLLRKSTHMAPSHSSVRRECSCDGSCGECRSTDQGQDRVEAAPRARHNFGDITVRSEAAFDDPCGNDAKCEVPGPAPAPAPAAPAPVPAPAPAPGPAAATIVHTEPDITWPAAGYSVSDTAGSSTTVERPFNVTYQALDDGANNLWRLDVVSATGGADIAVKTGNSRDPVAKPPTTEAEAQQAVTVMKGYYARGSRGNWHTEAASSAHEGHHYSEWQCSANDYWRTARSLANQMSISKAAHPAAADAVTAMRTGARGADALMKTFRDTAHTYWFTLPDNASSRPYAAGQLVLNNAISSVQTLAAGQGWTVEQGVDSPSAADPCFKAKPLWTW
jgi:hypothetical protein